MNIHESTLKYNHGETECLAFAAWPENAAAASCPLLLIVHMWSGRVVFVDDVARRMARQGLAAVAIDMYGAGRTGADADACAALMQPFIDDRALLQGRVDAGFNAALSLPVVDRNRSAAMGYCFGGLCVQDLARVNDRVGGVISVHGLMLPADNLNNPAWRAKVLLLHGADDPMVSDAQWLALKAEMDAAACDWQKHDFGGAMHAFTNPQANDPEAGTVYQAAAARRSDVLIEAFLQEVFAA